MNNQAIDLPGIEITGISLEKMQHIAETLASLVRRGDCIALEGDLGAGKTTFARFFIRALVPELREIISPTFMLVQTYTLPDVPTTTLYHADLYRLEEEGEMEELGLEEAWQEGICLIEWPQNGASYLPEEMLSLHFTLEKRPNTRMLMVKGSAGWQPRIHEFLTLLSAKKII